MTNGTCPYKSAYGHDMSCPYVINNTLFDDQTTQKLAAYSTMLFIPYYQVERAACSFRGLIRLWNKLAACCTVSPAILFLFRRFPNDKFMPWIGQSWKYNKARVCAC